MVGVMGSPGGTSDPVLEIFQMLKNASAYQTKYEGLVKLVEDANAAHAKAVDQQAKAAELTTKANAERDELTKKSDAFSRDYDTKNAAVAARETAVAEKDKACDKRAALISVQETALAREVARARAELVTAKDKFAAEMTSKNNELATRLADLASRERAATDNINRQIAELNQRAAVLAELSKQNEAEKAAYARKLAALKAITA